jgi:integrase
MLLVLVETGLRASELTGLDITDLNIEDCMLHVRHGKGDKARRVRFSPPTSVAVDRYLRARQRAILKPSEGPLWVNSKGGGLTYNGLKSALKTRAAGANVAGFHIHRTRHTSAVRWLLNGGSEAGLMAHHGWTAHEMVTRYTASASERIAAEEFTRLDMGFVE